MPAIIQHKRNTLLSLIALVIIVTLSLQGCILVGITEVGTLSYTSVDLLYGSPPYTFPLKNLEISYPGKKDCHVYKSDIEKEWGAPQQIINVSENEQEWKYKFGSRWRGIILIAILPVPLVIPVGREEMTFTFTDDNLKRYSIVTSHWCDSGGGVVLFSISRAPGFFFVRECKQQEAVNTFDKTNAKCNFLIYGDCFYSSDIHFP